MTCFDRIKEFDEDELVEFLFHFANDTIEQFSNFIMPNKDGIREFLDREIPN